MALKQNYSGWWPKYIMHLEVKFSRFWMNTLRLPLAATGNAYYNCNSIKGHLIASNKLSFDLISFGVCACVLSCVSQIWLFVIPWTVALWGSSVHDIFPSRILEWVTMPSILQRIFLTQGLNVHLMSPAQQAFFTTEPLGKPTSLGVYIFKNIIKYIYFFLI